MTVIDEKTRLPLSLVLSAVGFAAFVVFSWAALSNAVAEGARKNDEQDRALSQIAELKTGMAVIDAKLSTAIDEIRQLKARTRGH